MVTFITVPVPSAIIGSIKSTDPLLSFPVLPKDKPAPAAKATPSISPAVKAPSIATDICFIFNSFLLIISGVVSAAISNVNA